MTDPLKPIDMPELNDWNDDISRAPYMEVLWVQNEMMDRPILATRGYISNGMVNGDRKLFTSVFTPDKYFPTPSGKLVCPTKWKLK